MHVRFKFISIFLTTIFFTKFEFFSAKLLRGQNKAVSVVDEKEETCGGVLCNHEATVPAPSHSPPSSLRPSSEGVARLERSKLTGKVGATCFA